MPLAPSTSPLFVRVSDTIDLPLPVVSWITFYGDPTTNRYTSVSGTVGTSSR